MTKQINPRIATASAELGEFIKEQAALTAEQVGFAYELRPDAPSDYPTLLRAYLHSATTGKPLSILSENSESVIYPDPAANFALRFWHDINHVRQGLSFNLIDELELNLWHLGELEAAGYKRGSLVWRLLHADLVGSGYVQALGRRFPHDQRRFITNCVQMGFDRGLLAELRHADEHREEW